MSGSFLSNFSFTVVLNMLVKLFWVFVIEIAVQNHLGTEVYGTYFEAFNFGYLFFFLLDLGLSNYTTRTVAGDHNQLKLLFPSVFSLKCILSLLYLLVLFAVASLMDYSPGHLQIVMFIGLNHVLMSMLVFFRGNVSALHLFKTDALLSVADRVVMGIICAGLLWLPSLKEGFGLGWFLAAQFAGYLLSMVLAFLVVRRQGGHLKFHLDIPLFRTILRQSYPFAVLFFLMSVYTRVDSVMLGRMLPNGEFEVGIYASAFRLLDAAIIFTVLLSNLLLPLFSRMISRGESVAGLAKESFNLVLVAAVILPLVCFHYADFLYPLLYKEHHAYGSKIFALLFLNFFPMALGYVFGTLLTAKAELRLLNLISIAGLLANVVLNLVFIPRWQAMGAVYATLITQSIITLCTFYFSLRYFKLAVYDFINLRVILFVVLNALVFWSVTFFQAGKGLEGLLLCLVCGLVLVPLFRLINLKDIRALIGSRASASSSQSNP